MKKRIALVLALAAAQISSAAHATATFDFTVTAGNGGSTLFSGSFLNSAGDATGEGTHTFTGVNNLSAWSPSGSSLGSWGSGVNNLNGSYSVSYTVSGGAVTFNSISFNFGSGGLFTYTPGSNTGVYVAENTLPGSWPCDNGAGCKFSNISTTSFSTVTASNTTFAGDLTASVPEIDGARLPVAGFVMATTLLLAARRRRTFAGDAVPLAA